MTMKISRNWNDNLYEHEHEQEHEQQHEYIHQFEMKFPTHTHSRNITSFCMKCANERI